MFEHCWLTLGLFARMRSRVVLALAAMDRQLSPEATTWVAWQSWPTIPRHSACRGRRHVRLVAEYSLVCWGWARHTSPTNNSSQLGPMVPLFADTSWKLRGYGRRLGGKQQSSEGGKRGLTSTRSPWRRYCRRCRRRRRCSCENTPRPRRSRLHDVCQRGQCGPRPGEADSQLPTAARATMTSVKRENMSRTRSEGKRDESSWFRRGLE